jgi:hypothetical protein
MFKAASHDEQFGTAPVEERVLSPSPVRKSRSRFASNDETSVTDEEPAEKDFQSGSEPVKVEKSLV